MVVFIANQPVEVIARQWLPSGISAALINAIGQQRSNIPEPPFTPDASWGAPEFPVFVGLREIGRGVRIHQRCAVVGFVLFDCKQRKRLVDSPCRVAQCCSSIAFLALEECLSNKLPINRTRFDAISSGDGFNPVEVFVRFFQPDLTALHLLNACLDFRGNRSVVIGRPLNVDGDGGAGAVVVALN